MAVPAGRWSHKRNFFSENKKGALWCIDSPFLGETISRGRSVLCVTAAYWLFWRRPCSIRDLSIS